MGGWSSVSRELPPLHFELWIHLALPLSENSLNFTPLWKILPFLIGSKGCLRAHPHTGVIIIWEGGVVQLHEPSRFGKTFYPLFLRQFESERWETLPQKVPRNNAGERALHRGCCRFVWHRRGNAQLRWANIEMRRQRAMKTNKFEAEASRPSWFARAGHICITGPVTVCRNFHLRIRVSRHRTSSHSSTAEPICPSHLMASEYCQNKKYIWWDRQ